MNFPDFRPGGACLRPRELLGLADTDRLVHFVDAVSKPAEEAAPAVTAELERLRYADEVLLVRNSRDPLMTRFEFGRRGYARRPSSSSTGTWRTCCQSITLAARSTRSSGRTVKRSVDMNCPTVR